MDFNSNLQEFLSPLPGYSLGAYRGGPTLFLRPHKRESAHWTATDCLRKPKKSVQTDSVLQKLCTSQICHFYQMGFRESPATILLRRQFFNRPPRPVPTRAAEVDVAELADVARRSPTALRERAGVAFGRLADGALHRRAMAQIDSLVDLIGEEQPGPKAHERNMNVSCNRTMSWTDSPN
jgi:hypothetical protein